MWLTGSTDGSNALGRLSAVDQRIGDNRFNGDAAVLAARPTGEWHTLRVESRRDAVRVFVNGSLISVASELDEFAGYVALAGDSGRAEIRNAQIERLPASEEPFGEGALLSTLSSPIDPPRMLETPYPVYPAPLFYDRVQGTVRLEGVVELNGRLGDLRVIESVHPDLDEAAIGTVRKWRFRPAMLNGVPVRLVVQLEIAYNTRQRGSVGR